MASFLIRPFFTALIPPLTDRYSGFTRVKWDVITPLPP